MSRKPATPIPVFSALRALSGFLDAVDQARAAGRRWRLAQMSTEPAQGDAAGAADAYARGALRAGPGLRATLADAFMEGARGRPAGDA